MRADNEPDFNWLFITIAGAVGLALVAASGFAPGLMTATLVGAKLQSTPTSGETATPIYPLAEMLKLIVAALAGIIVTEFHKRFHRDRPLPRSLQQAQVLLCIAGAFVMIIIGNSLARAFGVAGAAGIVRFRTPVEDPKDTTLLFLLVTLGMACGIGQLELAVLGTVFLCLLLAALDRIGEQKGRTMILSIVAAGRAFPNDFVNMALSSAVNAYEVKEVLHGAEASVKYTVVLNASTSLAWLSQELMANGTSGLKSISWQEPGKKGN